MTATGFPLDSMVAISFRLPPFGAFSGIRLPSDSIREIMSVLYIFLTKSIYHSENSRFYFRLLSLANELS